MSELTLANRTLLLTRSAAQAEEFAQLVTDWKGVPVICPTIEIQPLPDYQAVDEQLQQLSHFDWLVFTSRNGVAYCHERLLHLGIEISTWKGKIAVVGPGTAQALYTHWQRQPDWIASKHESETLATELIQVGMTGKTLLCLRAAQAQPEFSKRLQHAGAIVSDLPIYQTVWPPLSFSVPEQPIDYITFASASAVKHFAERLNKMPQQTGFSQAKIASIGPITAQAALCHLGRVDVVADVHTLTGLLTAIAKDICQNSCLADK